MPRNRRTIDAGIQELPNGRFLVNIMHQRVRRTGTVDTYEQAKALAADFRAGKSFVPEIHIYEPWTVQQATDAYDNKLYAAKQRKGKTPNLTENKWAIRQICDALGAKTLLDDLTPARLANFHDDMLYVCGHSGSTINSIGSMVYQMQKHAAQRGHMRSEPLKMDRVKQSDGRIYFLTKDLQSRCIDWMHLNAPYEHYALFVLLLDTGARHTEGRTLQWSDVDLTAGRITFWGSATKTGKSRSVPMTDRLKDILVALSRTTNQPDIFHAVSADAFYNTWGRLRRAMGLQDEKQFVVHCLRHTAATDLVAGGVNLRLVQEWLGHSDIQTTMRYVHFAPEHLSAAVDVLNGRATPTTLQ